MKIVLIGAHGKMGRLCLSLLNASAESYAIVGQVTRNDDLAAILKANQPDIAIDFTDCKSVFTNSNIIIECGVRPLIGTSGLSIEQTKYLAQKMAALNLGGMIIPNFSLSIALINKFLQNSKQYFSEFSILEAHHRQKKDKPSATARHAAHLVNLAEEEIASIRSDAYLAKLEVVAHNPFERLTITHESFDRQNFSAGIKLSLGKIMQLNLLIIGLENLL